MFAFSTGVYKGSSPPQEAVLVMVNKRLLDAEALFSFSRMRLLRLADECRRQQVAMSVIPIAYAT